MKKRDLNVFKEGTALYVVAHAEWRKSRGGRRPSMTYGDIRNPGEAYRTAVAFVCEGAEFFPLESVLTVATHHFYSTWDELYDIFEFITGERPYTHQVPRFVKECKAHVTGLAPFVKKIRLSSIKSKGDIELLKAKYGRFHKMIPLPSRQHIKRDPVEELHEKTGKDNVMVILSH